MSWAIVWAERRYLRRILWWDEQGCYQPWYQGICGSHTKRSFVGVCTRMKTFDLDVKDRILLISTPWCSFRVTKAIYVYLSLDAFNYFSLTAALSSYDKSFQAHLCFMVPAMSRNLIQVVKDKLRLASMSNSNVLPFVCCWIFWVDVVESFQLRDSSRFQCEELQPR